MPSDFTISRALAVMAQPIAEFRSFVRSALREAEEFRAEQSASDDERSARARVELGDFALGRIDASRFATLFPAAPPVSSPARAALDRAIAAGGSSLRDYVQTSGELGYFQHAWAVYGREGAACPDCICGGPPAGGIRRLVQSGRSTFYCGRLQR